MLFLILIIISICRFIGSKHVRLRDDSGTELINHQHKEFRDKQRFNVTLQQERIQKLKILNSRCREVMESVGRVENRTLFYSGFSDRPTTVTEAEGALKAKCSFDGADCSMELIEQQAVDKYITIEDRVLEVKIDVIYF